MLKKIKDWIGSNLDVYRVTNASDVGAGLVRHEWQGENFATQIGTTLNAQIMNDMQKGLVHNLNSTLVQNIRESIYQTTLDGLDEFEIFDGLKIRLTVDAPNTNAGAKLRLNGVDYTILKEKNGQLGQIEAGDFKANKTYELTYNGSQFIVINLINPATETEAGLVTLNQIKGLIPTIPEASESRAGLITLAKIKELEGTKMAQMMGADYGGLLQTPGQKEVGKAYYDNVNKQMVCPIENNNLTYYETTKFIPISGLQNAKKMETLSNIETYSIDPRLTVGIIHKIGDICILTVDSASAYNGKNYGDVLFNIPEKFRPKILVPVPAGVHNSTIGGAAQIERNGNVVWRGSRITNSVYINAVYLAK